MSDLIEQARKAPFSQDGIAALAKGLDPVVGAEAARSALEAASPQAALVLAFEEAFEPPGRPAGDVAAAES